jgi:hypothetical protein
VIVPILVSGRSGPTSRRRALAELRCGGEEELGISPPPAAILESLTRALSLTSERRCETGDRFTIDDRADVALLANVAEILRQIHH